MDMDYERLPGPDGLEIRVPHDESYRTCGQCGRDCEPDASLTTAGAGARIAFACPEHGLQGVIDPFADMR